MTLDIRSLQQKYRRPKSLSDPFHDNTPDGLRALLAKRDDELRWGDFNALLGPHLPAGTYDEVAYFLPLALDHLSTHTGDAVDLCSSVVWFCSEYNDRLALDRVLAAAREHLHDLIREWTARFTVVHFDRSACVGKGWRLQHFDLVEMSETVREMLCDLVQYARHADIAKEVVADVAAFGADPVKAAWLLELIRSREGVCRPLVLEVLELASVDYDLLRRAYELAIGQHMGTNSPTYWKDTLSTLGMA